MKSIFCLLIIFSIFQPEMALSQELQFDISGKKMSDYAKLEKKLKGKIYEADGDIIIPSGMAMPIKYRRQQKGIPDLIVSYTFTEKDSLIYQIEYDWDPRNFVQGDATPQTLAFDQLLIKKYNELLASLTAKYGPSKSKGELTDLAKIETDNGLSRSDTFTTKNLETIYMSIIMSSHYRFNGTGKGLPLHFLRAYVNQKRK
jgi:hypothetical protein